VVHKQERSLRYELKFDVAYDDGDRYETAPVVNLSESGLFVQTAAPLAPGSSVRIVPLATSENDLFELVGEVVRTEDGDRPGMGVRFGDLTDAEREQLKDFCGREATNVAESLAQGFARAATANISSEEIDASAIIEIDERGPPPPPLSPVKRRTRKLRDRLWRKSASPLAGGLVISAWSEEPIADDEDDTLSGPARLLHRFAAIDPQTVVTGGLVVAFGVLALSVALVGGRVGSLDEELWGRDAALADGLSGFGADLATLSDTQGGLTNAVATLATSVGELRSQAVRRGLVVEPRVTAAGGIVTVATQVQNDGLGDVEVIFQRVRLYAGKVSATGATELNPPLEKGPVRWSRIVSGAHVTDAEKLDGFKGLGRAARRALSADKVSAGKLSALAPGEHMEDTLSFALPDSVALVGVVVEVGAVDSEGRAGVQKYKRVLAAK